ncbi:uncharacterized protein C24B11.05-like isoform X2 [Typha angustifolia]|uniref:uncharacterized protein C24B11.05-like isoform X2 n=1 Tax=Typha angustifolia TaxID=59011 RepID=UPI003C2D53AE
MAYEGTYVEQQRPKFDVLLFDLDDTLYPSSIGISNECLNNIGDYMIQKLGVEESKISSMCNLLYKNYGTTMAGLRAIGYTFDYDEYHRFYGFYTSTNIITSHIILTRNIGLIILFLVFCSFVHGRLPYNKLKPDPILRHLLLSLPVRKLIFTNADRIHAVKVLSRLGLEDCFEGIICFETLNPPMEATDSDIFDIIEYSSQPVSGVELPQTPILCKPSEHAMQKALKIANITPQRAIFFDDSVRNIQVGKSQRVKDADHALESIHNIREALPELWEKDGKPEDVYYSGKVAIKTPVAA